MRSLRASFRFFRVTSSTCSDVGEVGLFGELVEAIVQRVVPFGELTVLIVALQQEVLYFLRFRDVHGRTLLSGSGDD